ncbi:MAG: Nif3-like dinuclear metal center hexameric protein [bacterium]
MVMVTLNQICQFLDAELNIAQIKDESINGLQVEGKENIKKIICAVDASLETFCEAKKQNADMVIVHHGLLWDKLQPLTGVLYKRLEVLFKNDISLYTAHLPLDLHPEFGNNTQLMNLFAIKIKEPFGEYHGLSIGYVGKLHKEIDLLSVKHKLEEKLNTTCRLLNFGKQKVKTIAIVSGGGSDAIREAIEKEVDLFITGESKLFTYHLAKESKINIIFAGHYATETLGVKTLAEVLSKKFQIECNFVDIPIGL